MPEPKPLRWSKEPPTVAGDYWLRACCGDCGSPRGKPRIVHIQAVSGLGEYLVHAGFHNCAPALYWFHPREGGYEWSGPIPEPEEASDE